MIKLKTLDEIAKIRQDNIVIEAIQTEMVRKRLAQKYSFSSKNSRPRSSGEERILERFRNEKPVAHI